MQNIEPNTMLTEIKKPSQSFVKNNGQEDSKALFTTTYKDRRFFFSSDRITSVELDPIKKPLPESEDFPIVFHEPEELRNGVALELSFINANPDLAPEGISQQPGYHHYFKGIDSTKWKNGVPHYKELRYPAVWEGIDLELSASLNGMKMNWKLDRPDRVSSIRLHWAGADSLEIDATGNLLVHHSLGTLTDLSPIAYQEIEGEKKIIECVYRLYGSFDLGFELTGSYLENTPLIIDPILTYATYFGGSLTDDTRGITVDTQGCAYVTGSTTSINFPVTPGAFQTTYGGGLDAFVTKFSSNGGSLIYSTYLGGSSTDSSFSISLDTQDCAYVTGLTRSVDFPTTPGAFQTTPGGVFVTKLAVDGASLIYSTLLGSTLSGSGTSIVVDFEGCAHVTGYTSDTNFPTTPGAFQTTKIGTLEGAFITKLSADGESLIYSTFLEGSNQDFGYDIALDAQNHVLITGVTNSPDFPVTAGAYQTTHTMTSAFITKLVLDGSALIYSTFLSGIANSAGYSISVDSSGNACVTGRVYSTGFPVTPGAFQITYGGGAVDTFASKLSPGGDNLIASSYLGGNDSDYNYGGNIDTQGRVYVTGYTSSPNFPLTPEVIPSILDEGSNIYISIFSTDLTQLLVSYCLGGGSGHDIALGTEGAVYATGETFSTSFPATPGAYQTTLNGTLDAFVTKTGFAFYRQASVEIEGFI